MKIDANKIIGLLLTAMMGMCAWYLQTIHSELGVLRHDVFAARMQSYSLAVSIEIGKDGDPSTIPLPTMD